MQDQSNETIRNQQVISDIADGLEEIAREARPSVRIEYFERYILPEYIRNDDGTWPAPVEYGRFSRGQFTAPMSVVDHTGAELFVIPPPFAGGDGIPSQFSTESHLDLISVLNQYYSISESVSPMAASHVLRMDASPFLDAQTLHFPENQKLLLDLFLRYPDRLNIKHILGDDFEYPEGFLEQRKSKKQPSAPVTVAGPEGTDDDYDEYIEEAGD